MGSSLSRGMDVEENHGIHDRICNLLVRWHRVGVSVSINVWICDGTRLIARNHPIPTRCFTRHAGLFMIFAPLIIRRRRDAVVNGGGHLSPNVGWDLISKSFRGFLILRFQRCPSALVLLRTGFLGPLRNAGE